MKKLLGSIILLILFSCQMPDYFLSWYEIDKIPDELKFLRNEKIIHYWVVNNIHYKYYANGFKTAQYILDLKEGNCANISILSLALIYKITGKKGQLVFCSKNKLFHYAIRINNKIIDSHITEIYEIIDFDDISNYIYYRQ